MFELATITGSLVNVSVIQITFSIVTSVRKNLPYFNFFLCMFQAPLLFSDKFEPQTYEDSREGLTLLMVTAQSSRNAAMNKENH